MILYFSGTGNSEYIARRIAKATGDEILSLNERIRNGNAAAVRTERLVFVTPTYGWRIPRLVEKWIDETEFYGDELSAWFIMPQSTTRAFAREKALRIWVRSRSSCRKTMWPCSPCRSGMKR